MFLVVRNEYGRGKMLCPDPDRDIEPGHARHLYLKEEEVDRLGPQKSGGLQVIVRLSRDKDVRLIGQQQLQSFPGQHFVVDDQGRGDSCWTNLKRRRC